MGFPEIVIIAAAGFFLLWLWRGGGQPKPAVAPAACAAPSCGPPRAIGCLGVLFVLFIASGLLFIGSGRGGITGSCPRSGVRTAMILHPARVRLD